MTASLLHDAFAHHIWATERLIDACAELTKEQLTIEAPGTYGSILYTLNHLVISDCWYLTFFSEKPVAIGEDGTGDLSELRAAITGNGGEWMKVLAGDLDVAADVVEQGDGWKFHAPVGIRLAQVIHHGTDHRSQICTALTILGFEPPEIDLWMYGDVTGLTQAE